MDLDEQAKNLMEKVKKLIWQKKNCVLIKKQQNDKQDKIDSIKRQTEGFESKLTPLKVTKMVKSMHE